MRSAHLAMLSLIPAVFCWGQERTVPSASHNVSALQIVVVAGEGAINNIKARTAHEPIVEVQDQDHHPVSGAVVTFFVLNQGPGGTFAGDTQLLTAVTGQDGRAVGQSFRPNDAPGQFQIQVTASYSGLVAHAVINQTNVLSAGPPGTGTTHASRGSGRKIAIIAGVVGVAAIGAVAGLSHGGKSSSSSAAATPSATITLGTGGATVQAPH
jgi:hypothetical protein